MRRKPAAPRNTNTKPCVSQAAKEIVCLPERKRTNSLGTSVPVKQHTQVFVAWSQPRSWWLSASPAVGPGVPARAPRRGLCPGAGQQRSSPRRTLRQLSRSQFHQHFFPQRHRLWVLACKRDITARTKLLEAHKVKLLNYPRRQRHGEQSSPVCWLLDQQGMTSILVQYWVLILWEMDSLGKLLMVDICELHFHFV